MTGESDQGDSRGEQGREREPRVRRRGRRVTTEPAPGYIGEPPAERAQEPTENDDRLRQDKPPHWG